MQKIEVNVSTFMKNYVRFNREFLRSEKFAARLHRKPPFLSVYRNGCFLCHYFTFRELWAAYCENIILDSDRIAMYYYD